MSTGSNRDHIPSELKQLPQWVLWRYETRANSNGGTRQTKVPCQRNGLLAKSTDPKTWCSYQLASEALANNPQKFAGLGFVFDANDPYTGIDLDGALIEGGSLKAWAGEIVSSFAGAYMEVSPSGHGVKIWAKGKLPGAGKQFRISKDERSEMYDRGRFFAVTGQLYGTPVEAIDDHQGEIDRLYGRLVRTRTRGAGAHAHPQPEIYTEGTRHEALLGEAGRQAHRFGGDKAKTFDAIRQFNSAHCRPPKDEREVQSIVEWACSQERANKSPGMWSEPALLNGYDPEDVGNAQRLVAMYGEVLRYCHAFRKWLIWDGRRWKIDDADHARVLAHEMMKAFALQAVKANEEKVIKFAASCRRSARITNALREAEPLLPIAPAQLDTHPFLLNFLNGTLDLRTGGLVPHRREHFITKIVHHNYNPEAQCPLFLAFLSRAMGIHPDASEGELEAADRLIAYVQRALGYSLTGSTAEKAVFVLHGSGDNGKTTLLSTFLHILREYAVLLQIDSLMTRLETNNSQADIADLRGARFVMTSETEDGQRLAEGKLKRITQGMGKIKAVRKYENPIEFQETHKLFIDANHLPVVRGTDSAIWNRLHPVPFNITIPKEEQDKELQAKLLSEAEGILAWAVQGARRWYAEGLGKPPDVEEANKSWRAESDQLGRFIEDCCVVREDALVQARPLYSAYKKWAEDGGEWPESEKKFSRRMGERGFHKSEKSFGNLYEGLELRVEGGG